MIHEYAAHARELAVVLPSVAEGLASVGAVLVALAWCWAAAWAEAH